MNTPERRPAQKPERLTFKTYLQLIENTVGSNMFRNFYVRTAEHGEFDALGDGEYSCAFYVSSVLAIFHKISGIHGTVNNALEDLLAYGWQEVDRPRAGDVISWEPKEFPEGMIGHVGFALSETEAISNSYRARTPQRHNMNFGEEQRRVVQILRSDWHDA